MRHGEMRGSRAKPFEDFQNLSPENQKWRSTFLRGNFDVLPTDSTTPACLQCLKRSFFCRETRGIMLRGHESATVAVYPFGWHEHSVDKARCAQQHFANL